MSNESSIPQAAPLVSLLTEHQADLWAYIITQMPGSPDVADVLQKTNLTIWTKQSEFTPGTNFRAWAFTIARFEILAHLKKHKRGNWLVFSDELIEVMGTETAEAIPDTSTRLHLLEQCMGKLRQSHRELVNQRYMSADGLARYAASVGRSESSLYVTLHRVRATLRKCIEKGLQHGFGGMQNEGRAES
ncbi:sigma-70 family RNA polymerase sigma factor [Rubritalea tangerina]|uniref:Sigma-70 family RNA polymerase sigma factor n=2 Tax=Rubritalea tangerina TaxID=430798 RepID=A0ABW4ZEF1_9BACT